MYNVNEINEDDLIKPYAYVISAAEMLEMTNDNTKQSHAPFARFIHPMVFKQ